MIRVVYRNSSDESDDKLCCSDENNGFLYGHIDSTTSAAIEMDRIFRLHIVYHSSGSNRTKDAVI